MRLPVFAKVCYFILFIGNFPAYVVDNWMCEDMVHSKTRTFVQLGILLGLSGNTGDGMGVAAMGSGGLGEGLCYAFIQPTK